MQFLRERTARLAALTTLLILMTPALAQLSDADKKSSGAAGTPQLQKEQKNQRDQKAARNAKAQGEKGDRITRPRSPDVTGSPVLGTNSPAPNTTPASGGPGVNPNVEDKNPGSATGSQRGTPPRMSAQGRANTNRQSLPDSDKGKARAEVRKNSTDRKDSKGSKSADDRRARSEAAKERVTDRPRP